MVKKTRDIEIENPLNEPIAIIGMNCQLPGVDADIEEVDAFYNLLLQGHTVIKEIPRTRWNIDEYYDPDREKIDKMISRKGGFLRDPSLFDAAFFKISSAEAKQMDPQQRLILEVAIRALNHANITLESLVGSNTAVYCGSSAQDYSQLNFKDHIAFNAYTQLGAAVSAIAGRLVHFLNLKGLSMAVDTACSSSITALSLAVSALRNQQCSMAIVGGVHLNLCPENFIGLTKANMLSAQDECRSFDINADGFVRSEGCGVLIVKRLSDAIKDQNTIHAVLKSVCVNQDGNEGVALVAPNLNAQIRMHESVLAEAQLHASDIKYIEAHGSATQLGDSIEFNAIKHLHKGQHLQEEPLIIGAVKSNMGHNIAASGLTSLIKAIQALKYERIPPNIHYTKPNETIDPSQIPAVFPLQAMAYPKKQNQKRYAQIANFGFSGVNSSVILEEAPEVLFSEQKIENKQDYCFLISAKSEYSLQQMLNSYIPFLQNTKARLHDICFTLINCRDHYKYRCVIIASDREDLLQKIASKNFNIHKVTPQDEPKNSKDNTQQIAELYLAGANVRVEGAYQKVGLPLYHFDQQSYWHDVRTQSNQQVPLLKEKDLDGFKDWCFQLQWQQQAIESTNPKIQGNNWLLIGAEHLAPELQNLGLNILLEKDDYAFTALDGIFFAAALDVKVAEDITANTRLIKQLLALVKKLNEQGIERQLIILTHDAIAELPSAQVNLSSSSLIGFCKTLALELPQFKTILIDLEQIQNRLDLASIINELRYNHHAHYEQTVAYRGGKRWVSRLQKIRLADGKHRVNSNGRYLITGGCGGLGFVSAEALLNAGAKEIVLSSRTVDTPEILAAIQQLQKKHKGKIIRTLSLDVTDKDKLQFELNKLNTDGLLKGIIHAAGAGVKASLVAQKEDDVDYIFAAKAYGAWHLHELSQQIDLDFFVVYSSVSSVFGSNKNSVYSAANSFLDALVAERQRLGLVGTAIQWGPWGEAGMVKDYSYGAEIRKTLIPNRLGQVALPLLIENGMHYATIISPGYLHFMLEFVPAVHAGFYKDLATSLNQISSQEAKRSDLSAATWLDEYRKLSQEQRTQAAKELVTNICNNILETSKLDEDEGFYELGFNSLTMPELAARLMDYVGRVLSLTVNVGFDYPTINQLAHHIYEELDKELVKPAVIAPVNKEKDDEIAIIGMSCKIPEAADLDAFKKLMEQGVCVAQDIPLDRWDNSKFFDPYPAKPGKSYVNKLGLLDKNSIRSFDAKFFGISATEAKLLDPQQRLLLECTYKALENANYPAKHLRGSATGVYVGMTGVPYLEYLKAHIPSYEQYSIYMVTGGVANAASGRVSYLFDFKGPALSIDTACSSSMVAIHQACQALKNHEINYAIAAGVNVLLLPESNVMLSQANAVSPEGICKTFDESANGYARSEGCGVLFLKRLSDAVHDNDRILAVIKASVLNNDGKSAGLTAPNGKSQEDVMRQTLRRAGLSSEDISYVEAHGTATPIGDPIEVNAIAQVYGQQRDQYNPLYLGSVKTNIGHLESASGVVSVIKTVMAMHESKIYKHLHFKKLNPNIRLGSAHIALENTQWKTDGRLKSAAINNFGFSGTNAHLILQEYPEEKAPKLAKIATSRVLVLSAKSQESLNLLVERYQHYLATTADDFADICFTAAVCRDHYAYRLAVVAENSAEASQLLAKKQYSSSEQTSTAHYLPQEERLNSLVIDYLKGAPIDWATYYQGTNETYDKVTLPNYAFEPKEYWFIEDSGHYEKLKPEMHISEVRSPVITHQANIDLSFLQKLRLGTRNERLVLLSDALTNIVRDILTLDKGQQISSKDGLFALGFDSLMTLDIRSQLYDQLQYPELKLKAEYFINEPSIERIANQIADELELIFKDVSVNKTPLPEPIITEEIAVCDFQYNFWALNYLGISFNIGQQLHLKGKLNKEYVIQTFEHIVNNNNAFWLDFNPEIPTQRFRKDEGKFTLNYEDISADNDKPLILNVEFQKNIMGAISLTQQPLIRVYLYKILPDLHELHFVIPHIIVDEQSCSIVFEQFKSCYEALASHKSLPELPVNNAFLNYVKLNNKHYQTDLEKKQEFWRGYNEGFDMLYLGKKFHLPDATNQARNLYHFTLDSQAVNQFIAWHKQKNINVSTGLVAASQIVFYALCQQSNVPIILIHSGREGSASKQALGLFSEYKRINVSLQDQLWFTDCLIHVETQLIKTAPYQSCSHFIKDQGLASVRLSPGVRWEYFINKLRLGKLFKATGLNAITINNYIEYLSKFLFKRKSIMRRFKLNRLFNLNLAMQKPHPMRVLLSITPSFFNKSPEIDPDQHLEYLYPGHYDCMDRPVGNQTLWIYFSKNALDQYHFSINGPLTTEAKELLAIKFQNLIVEVVKQGEVRVADLIKTINEQGNV